MTRSRLLDVVVLAILIVSMPGVAWPTGPPSPLIEGGNASTSEEAEPPGGTAESASITPQDSDDWGELAREVAAQLESIRPKVETLEALKRPLTPEEKGSLENIYQELRPKVLALRQRRELVSKEERRQAKEWHEDLFTRIEILLQKTQAFAAPEEARSAPQIETMISKFAVYGSLRARGFADEDGDSTLDDSTSRIGFRGQLDVSKTYEFFGRIEVGTNLVGELGKFLIGGDPGSEDGTEDQPIPLRLAFIGFEGPQGRMSFGKQWSTFYDVAVFTDQAPFFGGAASGVYSAGTDGGVSGTGRADRALQYRFAISQFKLGVQAQIRDKTDNDQPFADTWGVSAVYQFSEGVTLGAAFNQVRDGITDPFPDEPIYDDQAFIVGGRWQDDNNYYAVTDTDFENHEKDDEGEFYSGFGVEVYADHFFEGGFGLGGTYNYQKPDSDLMSDYLINFLSVGGSYSLGKNWRFYLIYKFDYSQQSNGDPWERTL